MARKKTVSISRKPSSVTPPSPVAETAVLDQPQTVPGQDQTPRDMPTSTHRPTVGPIGRVVYGTVFCVSYGVVFSAILIGKFIPGSGLIGRGLQDGAGSARSRFIPRTERAEDPHEAPLAAF